MMKKFKILLMSLMMISVLVLWGCSSNGTNNTEVGDGNNTVNTTDNADDTGNTNTTDNMNNDNNNNSVVANPSQNNTQQMQNENISIDSIDSIKETVDNAVSKVEKVTVPDGEEERKNQFFNIKEELNSLEDQLDMYDDYLDAQYRQGNISYDDYKKWERKLDELENKLDAAEDKLERMFGIED